MGRESKQQMPGVAEILFRSSQLRAHPLLRGLCSPWQRNRMLPVTCKVSPLEKVLSLAEPCMGPASCKVCCLERMKESPGKASGVWELMSFSRLLFFIHLPLNVCTPLSRYESAGCLFISYASVLSLPVASSLGVELPSLVWDKDNHLPPFFGAPWSSRLAPEGAQPGAGPDRVPRPRAGFLISIFFNLITRQLCKLHSQETIQVCSCCRGLFWLCNPAGNVPPSLSSPPAQCSGKADAGSRLGKGVVSSKGLVSSTACLDGSQNTALKENLLDRLEKLSSLWGRR
ncbi:LOW QUALITY PROTEIN: uncharacterized protein LOC141933667 [Strix aluco]|uniref:LOW QUALITY PROTEIN: uncharacterized protein LOC141933667 n=1 Tax=Strix aluco TaxID=111821 RepID=UPI003DA48467